MPRGGSRPGAGAKKKAHSRTDAPLNPENRNQSGERRADGTFAPGNRANPGGRPKIANEVREYAGQHTIEAIQALVKIAKNGKTPPPVKVAAWREVLDRAIGRPPQAITGDGGGPVQIAAIVDELHP